MIKNINSIILCILSIAFFSCRPIPFDNLYVSDFDLNQFIQDHDTIILPKGDVFIDQIVITDNKTILTNGSGTRLIQRRGVQSKSLISIIGSNVFIDTISLVGNINVDIGEWSHGIEIKPKKKSIRNVTIEAVHAVDIRGDIIYVGSFIPNVNIYNVNVESVRGNNIFRNGISITSGENIRLNNIDIKNAGLFGIDLELNPKRYNLLKNITVGNSKIQSFGIIGNNDNLVSHITMSNSVIDGSRYGSNPPYKKTASFGSGIVVRNATDVLVESAIIKNQENFAISIIKEASDSFSDRLIFDKIEERNIAFEKNRYSCYNFVTGTRNVKFQNMSTDTLQDNISFILGNTNVMNSTISILNSKIEGGYLARYCKLQADGVTHNTKATNVQGLYLGSVIRNSFLKGKINSSYSNIDFMTTELLYNKKSSHNDTRRRVIKE